VPDELSISIDWNAWRPDPIFQLIRAEGNVPEEDMRRTFNLGIGLIFIVRRKIVDDFTKFLIMQKERPVLMGDIQRL